jgi:hypothetical protein
LAPATARSASGSILYHCKVTIDPEAEPGSYALRLRELQVLDSSGRALPAVAIDGIVDVRSRDGAARSSSSGCAIDAGTRGVAIWPLVAGAIIALIARRLLNAGPRAGLGRKELSLRLSTCRVEKPPHGFDDRLRLR